MLQIQGVSQLTKQIFKGDNPRYSGKYTVLYAVYFPIKKKFRIPYFSQLKQ